MNLRLLSSLISTFLFITTSYLHAEILWSQNWDNVDDYQTPLNTIANGVKTTHAQALKWNATDYRHGTVDYTVFSITSLAGRNGGKGIAYTMHGGDYWHGGSIGVAFSDPDIDWNTKSIDPGGYEEIFYSYWLKAPQPLQFTSTDVFNLWKGARMYAWDYSQYDWDYLYNAGGGLASHYIDANNTIYKTCFFIPSWAAPSLMYWFPQYNREQDGVSGTAYSSSGDNRSGTRLIEILNDKQWHHITYHVKLNAPASQKNSIYELYVDGKLISNAGSGLKMRSSNNTKIGSVILFDNYHKAISDGDQVLYIDDMVISTGPIKAIKIKSCIID